MSSASSELNKFQNETKIFRAGAGAGKTTELIAEVYNFYCFYKNKNKRNPKVVLTTFTRKATQELRERLMIEAQKKNDYDFLNFVLSKNQLMISTIHGVLQLFLRQYAQLLDLDPGFKLTNDKDIAKGAKIILKSLIGKDVRYLELLEEFPFSELTGLIIEHHQIKMVSPDATYFNQDDFHKEQTKILSEVTRELNVYSDKILSETDNDKWQEYCRHLKSVAESFESAKNINDIERALNLLKSFRKPNFQKKSPPFSEVLNEEFEEIRKSILKLNTDQFDPKLWDRMVEVYKLFDSLSYAFSEEFDAWKKSSGQISMSDLELYSYQLIRDYSAQVHFFSENFDYWLIDEFQDTSPLQKELLLSFIKDRKYFVVGDPQQSIYFFRGARVKVFDEVQDLIVSKKGIFELLNTNYRSSKATMGFINYFFEHYSKSFKSMELGGPNALSPSVAEFAMAVDKDSQKAAILNHILKLQSDGVSLGEICVLGRKNDQLKSIADALQSMKIPYIVHSASGFKDRREILDALAILKFLVNPHDNFNLIQVLRTPWFRIPDEEIYNIVKSRPVSFWAEFVKVNHSEVITLLRKYISDTYSLGITNTFQNILVESGFLDLSFMYDPSGRRESNLWKLLVQLKTDDHSADFNYLSFIQSRKSAIDLESGAEDSDAVSSIEPNRVQLMTVHMSKGLEFDHVIIPFIDSNPQLTNYLTYAYCKDLKKFGLHLKLGEEKGTSSLSGQRVVKEIKAEELSESDRLLYVAMTRAKKTIFMSTAGSKQNSSSWFKKIKLNLSEGNHKQKNFEYNVSSGPWSKNYSVLKDEVKTQILNPVYDLLSLKKFESSRVTAEVTDKKHQKIAVKLIEKANYGKLAHQVFESLKYGRSFDSDVKIQGAVDYIKSLEAIPMNLILKDGFAEWGFVTNKDGKNMSGQIDLWGIVNGELWVIDYKTGSSAFSSFAFEQLSHYANALKSYVGNTPIAKTHLVAIYPFEEKFILQSL